MNMRTFRRPFCRALTSRLDMPMMILVSIFAVCLIYGLTRSVWGCVIFLAIWSIICLPIFFTQYFYVILTDDQLMIKNSIFTFWHKAYLYKDIVKVEIMLSKKVYIKVYTREQKKFIWSYVIDLVDPCDYDELIDMLQARGIVVDAQLDIRYPNRNQHKAREVCNYSDIDVKTFRQSLWNTSLVKMNLTFTVIVSTSLAPVILVTTQSMWICLAFVLSCYALFLIYFTRHFYVVLFPDKLVIKNGVYSFMQKEYYFADIMKIKIERKKNIYMQVFTKAGEERVSRYCIDVVAPKDYGLLVEMIKLKGILVEIEGLDVHL